MLELWRSVDAIDNQSTDNLGRRHNPFQNCHLGRTLRDEKPQLRFGAVVELVVIASSSNRSSGSILRFASDVVVQQSSQCMCMLLIVAPRYCISGYCHCCIRTCCMAAELVLAIDD